MSAYGPPNLALTHRQKTNSALETQLSQIAFIVAFCTIVAIASPATDLKTLASFYGANGYAPSGRLVQGIDGNFYGTTWSGGTSFYSAGTIFKITPVGKLTILYNFCSVKYCRDGEGPNGGLVQAADGDFYGTTNYGGANIRCDGHGCGTVFKLTPAGKLTTLHNFCSKRNCEDGAAPYAGLVQGADGNFYGTTFSGGGVRGGAGTVFKITPEGKLTTLYRFSESKYRHGTNVIAGLVQGTDGNFYGTTSAGGTKANFAGTVFKITPAGKLTTLYSFAGYPTEGASPQAALVQASDGSFYGTTYIGGTSGDCSYFGCGTVFKITPTGKLTTLYSFCAHANCTDGANPIAALIQAIDGKLYGTTVAGGVGFGGGIGDCYGYESEGCGTLFAITGKGKLTTLHRFCYLVASECPDGANPINGLMQGTNGIFYGTTDAFPGGTVFSLTVERGRLRRSPHPASE